MTADEFKQQGNTAFSAGKFPEAIDLFSQAISLDPTNHVLYSNRSAAYASLKDYTSAVNDANETVRLKPDWAKGYSRKGAALHGLNQLHEAADAYKQGLKLEPNNALLTKGLQDVESAIEGDTLNGLGNIFGPDLFAKMASNPKLSPYLSQPDLVQKLQEIQKNPKNMGAYMQDQRVMQVMLGLMGLDGNVAANPEEMEQAKAEAQANLDRKKAAEKKAAEKKPEPEVSPEEAEKKRKRSASDAFKLKGNELYKARNFEAALAEYDQAFSADETNVAVLTNKSAVLFEMENYKECIKVCEEAVELGRSLRVDYKIIARALGRIGTSHVKMDDLENGLKYYGKSLAEHRSADIQEKMRELEAEIKKRKIESYIDPVLAEEAREKGNELFKEHNYAEAVKFYAEAIKRNPSDPKSYSNRAAALAKLMALPEAEKDCNEAIRLDENFLKAYIRKAAIQASKREYQKSIDTCNIVLQKDTEGKHKNEVMAQVTSSNIDAKVIHGHGTAE
jgi:stress-induced-phosphoprotein 1